jgi:hypothetical protein
MDAGRGLMAPMETVKGKPKEEKPALVRLTLIIAGTVAVIELAVAVGIRII